VVLKVRGALLWYWRISTLRQVYERLAECGVKAYIKRCMGAICMASYNRSEFDRRPFPHNGLRTGSGSGILAEAATISAGDVLRLGLLLLWGSKAHVLSSRSRRADRKLLPLQWCRRWARNSRCKLTNL
jgi:hypothetical protein